MANFFQCADQLFKVLIRHKTMTRAVPQVILQNWVSAFRELNSHFRAAMRRGCDLKSLPPESGSYNHWRMSIGFDENDFADFQSLTNEQMSNLQYLQDRRKMTFWALAMSFLEQEQEGFPGRMVFKEDGGGYRQMPKPKLCRSSWPTHID